MANTSGKAYALNVLSPIKQSGENDRGYVEQVRTSIQNLGLHEQSPFANIPQTYLARLFILDDVVYESLPGADRIFNFSEILSIFSDKQRRAALPHQEHLKSKYLVFVSNFHGELDDYLEGMWLQEQTFIKTVWQHCVAFDQVNDLISFKEYIYKCQLDTTLFFNGSTDDSLQEQLKGLYVKQELANFAMENQGKSAEQLQQAYQQFISRVQLENLDGPSWKPAQSSLAVEGEAI